MIFYHLAFLHDTQQHGGKNRSEQLYAWIKSKHPEAKEWKKASCPNPILTFIYGLWYAIVWQSFKPLGKESLRMLGHEFYAAKHLLKNNNVEAIYIEGTGFGATAIAAYFKSKNIDCHFMPCNLESLVPYTKEWTHSIAIEKRFQQEIKLLKYATTVYAISITEHWLLKLFSINTALLPYKPVGETLKFCHRIKKEREDKGNKGSYYMYLANFNNAPNQNALANFMEAFSRGDYSNNLKLPVKIVGRGIQNLNLKKQDGLMIGGELSQASLEEHLIDCAGVILFHYPTSGALTRLHDYLEMDIPIYANDMAIKGMQLKANTKVTLL